MLQLITILLRSSILLDAGGATPDPPPASPPSVVLVIADDAGWIDFGFNGGAEVATPALDRLAGEGLTFGACYVT
ncbi:MAG: sulfatase-like hydrolase/transferase, partial [Phycisphaeraceae bacterium]|nr:sulfatase-like hydrolase/transferase [Phycisphaeraceae bacterium]